MQKVRHSNWLSVLVTTLKTTEPPVARKLSEDYKSCSGLDNHATSIGQIHTNCKKWKVVGIWFWLNTVVYIFCQKSSFTFLVIQGIGGLQTAIFWMKTAIFWVVVEIVVSNIIKPHSNQFFITIEHQPRTQILVVIEIGTQKPTGIIILVLQYQCLSIFGGIPGFQPLQVLLWCWSFPVHNDHFEDFHRKQYTIEIFSPMILFCHEDSKYATLEIKRWALWKLPAS